MRWLKRIARKGASSTNRATGRRAARYSARVAPVENPMTTMGPRPVARASYAFSTVAAQSRQHDEGMIGPGPSWPGSTGAETRRPSVSSIEMTGPSSYAPPPRPCSTRQDGRGPWEVDVSSCGVELVGSSNMVMNRDYGCPGFRPGEVGASRSDLEDARLQRNRV